MQSVLIIITVSMKIFNRGVRYIAVLTALFVAVLSGCTTVADYSMGEEFAPGHQQMVMRHRSYKGGMLKETDVADTPCKVFESRLFKTDTVNSGFLNRLYLGVQHNERFGTRKLAFVSQYLFDTPVHDSIGFGYRPVFDSAVFLLSVDTIVGDTMKPVKFNVYALEKDLFHNHEDSTFYVNYDPRQSGHISEGAEPIFTFQFPDHANGVYTTSTQVRMQETSATKDFIDLIFCRKKLDSNGLANYQVENYQSDSAFVTNFKGIYVEPAYDKPEQGDGVAFSIQPSETGFQLFGRTRNSGHDADLLADTISIGYICYDAQAVDDYGNNRAQSVKFDFSNSDLASMTMLETEKNRPEVELGYVSGCGGVMTELNFTDEFLNSLSTVCDDGEYIAVAVNQASLKFYIEDADYDYTKLDPLAMADKLDTSISRLGLYYNYKRLSPIIDYLYNQEENGMTYYNGYMNRSLACYNMNISSYMQELINEILKLEREADGSLDFSKLSVPRKLYLAPGANDRFTLNHSIIQGGDAEQNKASISIDITYTLIK